jgi:hypothetical protein
MGVLFLVRGADIAYCPSPQAIGPQQRLLFVQPNDARAEVERRAHAAYPLMEKLGFVYEGAQARCVFKRGGWIGHWMVAITRPDWENRTGGLAEGVSAQT